MPTERIQFQGPHGKLAAKLDLPDGTPRAYGLYAHCFTCSKDVLAANRICNGLAAQGVAMLRFDFAGLGNSEGDFSATNFSSNVADLLAAADFLRTNYAAPSLLVGHSLGGAAVLAAAGQIPEAQAVVTLAAPSTPSYVIDKLFSHHAAQIAAAGQAQVPLGGRDVLIRQQFIEDVASYALEPQIAALGQPLLVLHAPEDDTVDPAQAQRIFDLAHQPKSIVSLDGIDHLVTGRDVAAHISALISAWSARYLNAP